MNPYAQKSGVINQVSSKHEPPEPATSRKHSPAEALELKIKLPWAEKVQPMKPVDLTPDLFVKLEEYGLYRQEIKQLFGFKFDTDLYRWIHKNNIASSGKTGTRTCQPHREPKLSTKPGQTKEQAAAKIVPAEDEDGLNYQDRHNLGIHSPTAEEIADVFRPEESLPADLSGWETFDINIPSRPRSLIVGAKKIYVGVDVKFIKEWERCCVKVRPDGKQLALEKTTGTGYKVGKDHQRPANNNKQASEKIAKLIGAGAEFVPIIENESLVVFEHRGQ